MTVKEGAALVLPRTRLSVLSRRRLFIAATPIEAVISFLSWDSTCPIYTFLGASRLGGAVTVIGRPGALAVIRLC